MQKGRRAMRDEGLDTLTIGFAIYHLKDPEGAPRYVLIIKQNIYIYLFKKFIGRYILLKVDIYT